MTYITILSQSSSESYSSEEVLHIPLNSRTSVSQSDVAKCHTRDTVFAGGITSP